MNFSKTYFHTFYNTATTATTCIQACESGHCFSAVPPPKNPNVTPPNNNNADNLLPFYFNKR